MIIFRSGLSIVVSKQQNSLLTPIYSKKHKKSTEKDENKLLYMTAD